MPATVDHIILELARDLARGEPLPKRLEKLAGGCGDRRIETALREAARGISSGQSPTQALLQSQAIPEAYIAAIQARDPDTVAELIATAQQRREFDELLRSAALRSLALLTFLVLGLAVGTHIALPAIERTMNLHGFPLARAWHYNSLALRLVLGPVGGALILTGFFLSFKRPGLVLALRRSSLITPYRAAVCRAVAALLRSKTSVERALLLASTVGGDRRMRHELNTASLRVAGGHSVREALVGTSLDDDLVDTWSGSHDGLSLAAVAESLAEVYRAGETVARARIDARANTSYAVVGGGLAIWAALSFVSGLIELTTWLAYY